jgi:membrane-bound lytic murein transglycosylase
MSRRPGPTGVARLCGSSFAVIRAAGLLAAVTTLLAACAGGPPVRPTASPASRPAPHRTVDVSRPTDRERPSSSDAVAPAPPEPARQLVPVESLKGWSSEDHRAALAAFRVGCRVAHSVALRRACQAAAQTGSQDPEEAKRFFERHFRAVILPGEGVLTGYFAPVYPARRQREGPFTAPVRSPPPPGQLIYGPVPPAMTLARTDTDAPVPAATPAAAVPTVAAALDLAALEAPSSDPVADLLDGPAGASAVAERPATPPPSLPALSQRPSDPVISPADPPPQLVRVRMREAERALIDQAPADGVNAWMRPEDLFFLQIQGSGVLVFPDGQRQRAAYAGDNGKPFVGIARPMIREGLLPANGASGDGIRRWLADHAGATADAVMQKNPRYVFFRLGPDSGAEPPGAAGVPLPPGRAIAMDSSHHDFGAVYWIDAEAPTLAGAAAQYHRLAVDLDTGGAIRGPIRADLYFGTGDAAGREAGRVKHVLRLARLMPVDDAQPEESDAATASPRGR